MKEITKILPVFTKNFDEAKLIDNSIKGKPRLVATGGSGKGLAAVDEKLFKKFIDKEDYTQQMILFQNRIAIIIKQIYIYKYSRIEYNICM